ncbi:MAG: sulfatase [Elusimicrobiota bacterium]
MEGNFMVVNLRKVCTAGVMSALLSFNRAPSECGAAEKKVESKPKPPNIVFILIDDLRWDACGYANHPFSKTPNIDKLASNGVVFNNSFVTIALCGPSRACFLTGQYAHKHQVLRNRDLTDISTGTLTYPLVLQQNGYTTAYVGKWHMAKNNRPRRGFDYWLSFTGQGDYTKNVLNENGTEFEKEGYITDVLTEYAVKWLDTQKQDGKPFMLYLSHKAVHDIFTPPPRYAKLYADAEIPEPANFRDDLSGKPVNQRKWLSSRLMSIGTSTGTKTVPPALPPVGWSIGKNDEENTTTRGWVKRDRTIADMREDMINYHRCLAAVDDSVNKVVEQLDKLGVLDNTMIIFAGDNGYLWYEHRFLDKRWAYEESMRIPLVIQYPKLGRMNVKVDDFVLNIDLAPTILDFAGVPVPDTMQGRSARPLMEGKVVDNWRKSFFYEYYYEKAFKIPSILAVRTKEWKYVTYPDIQDIDELYDLVKDPNELNNLAEKSEHSTQLNLMKDELQRLINETGYVKPVLPAEVQDNKKVVGESKEE